jgi:hypothetical protein
MVQAQPSLTQIRDLLQHALAGADALQEIYLGVLIDGALQEVIARIPQDASSR